MGGAREREEGESERMREGAMERGRGTSEEHAMKGDSEGGKLQGRYH